MQKAPVTHHQVTDAQPVSEQQQVWPTSTPHPQFYCWAWLSMVWDVPLVSWDQLSHCVPSAPLAYLLVVQSKKEKRPWCCVNVLLITKISLLSTLCSSQVQNIAPCKLLWRKLTPWQPKPVQTERQILWSCQWFWWPSWDKKAAG